MKRSRWRFLLCGVGGLAVFGVIEMFVYLPVLRGLLWLFTLPAALPLGLAFPAMIGLFVTCICVAAKAYDGTAELQRIRDRWPEYRARQIAKGMDGYALTGSTAVLVAIVTGAMILGGFIAAVSQSYPYENAKIVNQAKLLVSGTQAKDYVAVLWKNAGENWNLSNDGKQLTMSSTIVCPLVQKHPATFNQGAVILGRDGKPFVCKSIGIHSITLQVTP